MRAVRSSEYSFHTRWRVLADVREVWDVLSDPTRLPEWWPAVYLSAHLVERGDPDTGVGARVLLHTKGWLPYTLRWTLTVDEVERGPDGAPARAVIGATGDLTGRGVWQFHQEGLFARIDYDWHIQADKPLLRRGTPVLRPLFAWNHRWAMDVGLESLVLELARRRERDPEAQARIPRPPAATFR